MRWVIAAAVITSLTTSVSGDCDVASSATAGAALLQVKARRGQSQSQELEAEERPSLRPLSALQKSGQALSALSARSGMYVAHQAYVRRAMQTAKNGRNPSNQELDLLITRFIAAHTASEDHCPAELLEAKHQLNALHQEILNTLAAKVDSEEVSILKDSGKLTDNAKKIKELDDKKDEDDKKLAEKKAEICAMLETLKSEIRELRAIAQPQVTMNISTGALNTAGGVVSLAATGGALSLLQEAIPPQLEQVSKTQALVRETHAAAKEVLYCMEDHSSSSLSLTQLSKEQDDSNLSFTPGGANCSTSLSASVTVGQITQSVSPPATISDLFYRAINCTDVNPKYGGVIWLHCANGILSANASGCIEKANATNCTLQKSNLERAYVKAYVELARLIDEYEQQCSATDEQEALDTEYQGKYDTLKDEKDKLEGDVAENTADLASLKPKLDDALIAEGKLQAHVQALSTSCSDLNATESSLDDVRAAIHALEACPGLVRPVFHIPKWVGTWTDFILDNTISDAGNDAAMLAACESAFPGAGTRPAEAGEIEATSIEGMPRNNTATVPLLGACPKCEGRADTDPDSGNTNFAGHSRICWFPGVNLTATLRSTDCSQHSKAIMCVTDQGRTDVRKVVWSGNDTVS